MSIRSKLLKKLAKRVGSKAIIRKSAKKAMTFAQKGALKKAVKASALARRKSAKTLAKRTLTSSVKVNGKSVNTFRKMSNKQLRAIISTKTSAKHFKAKKIGGKVFTASQQSRVATKQLRAAVKAHNGAVRGYNRNAVRAAKGLAAKTTYSIDLPRSLAYSAALTAALNPSYTAAKYKEAKAAIKTSSTGSVGIQKAKRMARSVINTKRTEVETVIGGLRGGKTGAFKAAAKGNLRANSDYVKDTASVLKAKAKTKVRKYNKKK